MVAASTGMVLVIVRLGKSRTATLAGAGAPLIVVPPHCKPQFRIYAVLPLMMAYTGRLPCGSVTTEQTALGGFVKQLTSTGGTAEPGESTVIESESLLKTRSWLPPEFAITVCALVTAIVVTSPPPAKFISATAPRKEKPLTVAVGTAAYPIGFDVGSAMLEVGPERRTLPMAASLVVSTA